MRVGIVGCGAIGSSLAEAIDRGDAGDVELVIIYDRNLDKVERVVSGLRRKPGIGRSIDDVISSECDLVIEVASQEAVRNYGRMIIESGKDLMVLSVGALSDPQLFRSLMDACRKHGRKLYIPSGSILGVDGVFAAAMGGIEELKLVTRKPAASLGMSLEGEKLLYSGNASEAARKFPSSVNVAATLGLAAMDMDRVNVEVVADPSINRNVHEIRARGKFGEFSLRIENVPSQNPRTSMITIYSVIAMLRKLTSNLVVGT